MFHEKIKQMRKRIGKSQEELAEGVGVTRQAVSKWESGAVVPDMYNLIKMSQLFNVTIDYLVKPAEECQRPLLPVVEELPELQRFLYRAKLKTYAANGPKNVLSLRQSSSDYRYQEGAFQYHDSYLGNESFIGEEVVYCRDQPVWGLSYAGKVLGDSFSSAFLKEALLQVPMSLPLRGPAHYSRGAYHYQSQATGDFNWFNGTERLFHQQEIVFECFFSGGKLR